MRASARQTPLFRDRLGQAVRIPREFELAAETAFIRREDRRLVIEPVEPRPSLAEVLAGLEPLDEDFPHIADPPARPEDVF